MDCLSVLFFHCSDILFFYWPGKLCRSHQWDGCMGKAQCNPRIYAKKDNQQRLESMHDQDKIQCLVVRHAIEDEHRLDGEMPRSCSVRCRHDDGNRTYHKADQRTGKAEMCRRIEAEESQVIMQEIAPPYRKTVEKEQGDVPYFPQRTDALPYTRQHLLHLII